MKKTCALFLGIAFLTACAPDMGSTVQPEYMVNGKIMLDVQRVNFSDHSAPPGANSPYNRYQLQPTITQAVRQWALDRLQASGTEGQATVVVRDASLTSQSLPVRQGLFDSMFTRQQNTKYTGHVDVQIEMRTGPTYAVATAEATHSVSLPEDPSEGERRDAYMTLMNGLMRDLNRNLEASIRQHLQSGIVTPPVILGSDSTAPSSSPE